MQTILPHPRHFVFQRKQNSLRCVDTVLQISSFKCWPERNNYYLQPDGCPLACIVQKAVAFLCSRMPNSFPAKLLSGELDHNLYWCIWYFFPKGMIWHFTSLNFMRLQLVYFSSLLRSLWVITFPSTLLTSPLIFYTCKFAASAFYSIYRVIH